MTIPYPIVGIDIGKDTLGSFLDAHGRSKLAKKLKAKGIGLVVFEATGGYEVPVMAALAAVGVPLCRAKKSCSSKR